MHSIKKQDTNVAIIATTRLISEALDSIFYQLNVRQPVLHQLTGGGFPLHSPRPTKKPKPSPLLFPLIQFSTYSIHLRLSALKTTLLAKFLSLRISFRKLIDPIFFV